ncbi:MAG: hotdog domain-containing protein, partial [Pseudomonadota bacterium]
NNVAMAAMFEDARVRFNHPMRDHFQTDQIRTLVAGQTLNYLNECYLRPDLTFRLGIGHIGSTSWVMQAAAWQGERPVLLAMATLVSTQDGRPCSVPEGLRDMLEARRMSQPS